MDFFLHSSQVRWALVRVAMARCMMLMISALWAGAGIGFAEADYSAVRMPQYDSLNYETHAASPPAEDYRSPDVAAPIDYNNYDQESIDRRNSKILHDEDSYHMPFNSNLKKESKTTALDDIDADYNLKSEETNSRTKYNNRKLRNRNNLVLNVPFSRRAKSNSNVKKYQQIDDDDTEVQNFEDEKDLGSESDKSKFVRRDISQKLRRKSRNQAVSELKDPDYDDQSDARQGKDAIKSGGQLYSDPDLSQDTPIGSDIGSNRANRPLMYKAGREDNDDSDLPSSSQNDRNKAPMPKPRKKSNEYVDYNDMSRIEKIKNQSPRRTTARSGTSRRWSYQDGFRRRYFNTPPPEAEEYPEILTTAQNSDASVELTSTNATPPWLITGVDEPIAPLSIDQIQNITAFVNKSKQLSIAELSQLSILKKARRKDSVKDEMLKDKPPVLLQVTERLQTVVMVEPPLATQEPWLRARDISEDSPERIAKVKRFMRNKLVANARNISELMENWDDTVCDYVDISLLDESRAVWMHGHPCLPFSLCWILAAYSAMSTFGSTP